MLFFVSIRLMFRTAVSEEDLSVMEKKVKAKQNHFF